MNPLEILAFLAIIVVIIIVARIIKSDHANSITDKVYNRSDFATSKSHNQSDLDNIFSNVVDFLKSSDVYFRYGKNKKEKDYQQDLDQKLDLLKYKYGYEKAYEGYKEKQRIDFIINGIIGIEMKVYRGGSQVKKELFYQVSEYGTFCEKMVALVINLTQEDNSEIGRDIKQKLEEVMDKNNLEVIVKTTINPPQ
ncbi:MAG TPA: hypothetical protein VMW67_04440 [Desulfobacteria bacterium]|nr:hypothetical protein [Desulfobacteria bacterium]